MMRRLFLSTCLTFAMTTAWADDRALLIGAERYAVLDRSLAGTSILRSAAALNEMGYDTSISSNGSAGSIRQLLRAFTDADPAPERMIVALSGRFATDGDRSWFLAANAEAPDMFDVGARSVSIETLLNIMAATPGQSLLILAPDPRDDARYDAGLRAGLGDLDIPQGVTVVRGRPGSAADLLDSIGAEPGVNVLAEVRRNRGLRAMGYAPDRLVMVPAGRAPRDFAAEEREKRLQAWENAVAEDTAQGYMGFLNAFPDGRYVVQANTRLSEIRNDPVRQAMEVEDQLKLDRNARRDVQRDLTVLDFNTRGIDGIFGPGTRGAVINWQQQNGFRQTGYLNADQINRLDAQASKRQQELEDAAARQRAAEERRDRAYWDETGAGGEIAGLRAYLERYPDGLFSSRAQARIKEVQDARRAQANANDKRDWDRARDAGSVTAYRAYLNTRPRGQFRDEAQAAIQRLQAEAAAEPQQRAAQRAEQALRLDPLSRRLIEARLDAMGLEPGTVDGNFDRNTRRALRRYQRDRNLPRTGFLSQATVSRILTDAFR